MKYLILLAALLINQAYAVEIDLGVHYVKTEKPNNMVWFQEEFSNDINRTDTGYSIGLRFNPWDNIYLTTGYKYLGEFSVDADFIGSDDNYLNWRDKGAEAPPVSRLYAKGKSHGIYFKGEYHFKHFFLTGGTWYHKSEWESHAPELYFIVTEGDLSGEVYGPINVYLKNDDSGTFGYIAGVGVKIDQLSVTLEVWDTATGGDIPASYLGGSKVLGLIWAF